MARPARLTSQGPLLNGDGYVLVRCPNHPRAAINGYVLGHILVAEELLGRYLKPNEEIHHYGDRADNTKIVICESPAYHKLLETRQRALKLSGSVHNRKCVYCQQYDNVQNLTRQSLNTKNYYHKPCRNKYERERRLNKLLAS